MVRAGVVKEPAGWSESGYTELMQARKRYQLLDLGVLAALLGAANVAEMREQRRRLVDEALRQVSQERESCWSESLAVGDEGFAQGVKNVLGLKVRKRAVTKGDQGCVLLEAETDYGILALKIPL
jgi:putative transposase